LPATLDHVVPAFTTTCTVRKQIHVYSQHYTQPILKTPKLPMKPGVFIYNTYFVSRRFPGVLLDSLSLHLKSECRF